MDFTITEETDFDVFHPKGLAGIEKMKRVACQAAALAGIKGALNATLFHVDADGNEMIVDDPCELWYVLTQSTENRSTTPTTPTFVAAVQQAAAGSEEDDGVAGKAKRSKPAGDNNQTNGMGAAGRASTTQSDLLAEDNDLASKGKRRKAAGSDNQANGMGTTARPSTTQSYDSNAAMTKFEGQKIDINDFRDYLVGAGASDGNISRIIPQVKKLMSGDGIPYLRW